MQPCKLAEAAAADPAVTSTFPVGTLDPTLIITIIQGIVSIFQNCMRPPTPAAARQHVLDGWHNGAYDHGTMRIAMHQAKQAARQAGTRVDNGEATVLATATLDQIRLSDDATLQAAMDSVA